MDREPGLSVWDRLREYAESHGGTFTSQEVISWFRRHAPGQATDGTIRVHTRGASWNVNNRAQFATREPFLTRVGHGTFKLASSDEIERWRSSQRIDAAPLLSSPAATRETEWHDEASTQHLLIKWLIAQGWTIVSAANTATREHGVDVVAERGGARLGVEVKGYPSRYYATGPKKGQLKKTTPANQAPKWFAHALVPAMKLRSREPQTKSVICFPDFPIYRRLWSETASSLAAAEIDVWVVTPEGSVEALDLTLGADMQDGKRR